jgi:hypothetical protein
MLLGMIPNLPTHQDQLVGEWIAVNGDPGVWRFRADGDLQNPFLVHGFEALPIQLSDQHGKFYVVDDDHLEVKTSDSGSRETVRIRFELGDDRLELTFGDPERSVVLRRNR